MSPRTGMRSELYRSVIYELSVCMKWVMNSRSGRQSIHIYVWTPFSPPIHLNNQDTADSQVLALTGGARVRFKCQPRHHQKLPMAITGWFNGFAVLFLICWNGKINSCSCSHSFLFYCFKIKSKEKTIFTSNLQCSASGRLLSVWFKKAAVWPNWHVAQAEVTNTVLLPLQHTQHGKWHGIKSKRVIIINIHPLR